MVLLERVRSQYDELPYPPRDPGDERDRLITNQPSQLALTNHIFWGGARSTGLLRVLDAGCGTGDSTICMAEQLRGTGARVTALDFSPAALEITRRRAAVRELDNIDLVAAPLEELSRLGLGEFDFVLTSGVLHHLASPEAGLEALRDVLAPEGGMAIMVYAAHGRQSLYIFQQLLAYLAPPDLATEERLRILRQTLAHLPADHPVKANWEAHGEEADRGDAALVDMFLHTQDRAYTVPQLYQWLAGAELQLATFDVPRNYDPSCYDDRIAVSGMSAAERHAVAELLHGRMGTHILYAARTGFSPPEPPDEGDPHAVPAWSYIDFTGARERALADGDELTVDTGRVRFTLGLDAITRGILRRVDGETPLGTIVEQVNASLAGATAKRVRDQWRKLYRGLRDTNVLLLNYPR